MAAGTPLTGRIAVVAGATRGAGRGIARALNEAGALDADGRRPDWGAHTVDLSRHPAWLVEHLRAGARIQLEWFDAANHSM